MSERIEFSGSYYEEIKESEKDWLKELETLFSNKQDSLAKSRVKKHLADSGLDTSKLAFHEGANHIEWKKNSEDYFVIERHSS